MTTVQYDQAAENELLNAIAYFELRARGLGRRFFSEVQRTESLIAQFPLASREILPGIRKRPLRKFPYSLIYSNEQDPPADIGSCSPTPSASLLGPAPRPALTRHGGNRLVPPSYRFSSSRSLRVWARLTGTLVCLRSSILSW